MNYDLVIIGAGPGGIFSCYEACRLDPSLRIAVIEAGSPLEQRKCPIDGVRIKSCINCPTCAIMNGFGGAGAFSDGKYNITNQFGGSLYEYVGKQKAIELMEYVDSINTSHGGEQTRLFSNNNAEIRKKCLENDLHLLDAKVRHLGTDINYIVLQNLFDELKDKADFFFHTRIEEVRQTEAGYQLISSKGEVLKESSASSPPAEAAASGCRRSVIPCTSGPRATEWISVCVWNCRPSSSPT